MRLKKKKRLTRGMRARVMALEKHRWGYFRILPFVIIEEIIEIGTYRAEERMYGCFIHA